MSRVLDKMSRMFLAASTLLAIFVLPALFDDTASAFQLAVVTCLSAMTGGLLYGVSVYVQDREPPGGLGE